MSVLLTNQVIGVSASTTSSSSASQARGGRIRSPALGHTPRLHSLGQSDSAFTTSPSLAARYAPPRYSARPPSKSGTFAKMIRAGRPVWLAGGAFTVLVLLHVLFRADNIPAEAWDKVPRRSPTPRKPIAAAAATRPLETTVVSEGVEIDARGLTQWSSESSKGRHPIEDLIERGKKIAMQQEARIREVHTLQHAVEEYERAYGMAPPQGFDWWFDFTQKFNPPSTSVAPLLPFAFEPFLKFLSIPADILRDRVASERETDARFTLTFVPNGEGDYGTACEKGEDWFPEDGEVRGPGRVIVGGPAAWSWRCNNTLQLMLPLLPEFPPEFFRLQPPLEIPFGTHDGPIGAIHSGIQERSEALGRAGKVWGKASLAKAEKSMAWTHGWHWTCPDGTPLRNSHTDMILNDLPSPTSGRDEDGVQKSFIADFDKSIDICHYPELMDKHIVTLGDKHRSHGEMYPTISVCKSKHNSDLLGVALDGAWEDVKPTPWQDKTIPKAFWRGSATGVHHNKDTNWRSSQRERLHFLAQNVSDEAVALMVDTENGVETRWYTQRDLNDAYVDAGLVGGPHQCSEEDGSCDDMAREIDFLGRVRKEDSLKYKFVIDVDGNGWSSRFRRLLSGNNVVLKSTLYPEWFSEQLIPWYHYVPLKIDYSDIYDIMAFFEGAPDGSTLGRDDLAEEIAYHGRQFVEEKWRIEDMGSYMYLLFLEYFRLMSEDRKAASFHTVVVNEMK